MTFWYWLLSWLPFEWAAPDTMLFMKNALLAVLVVTPLFGLLSTMVVESRMAFFSDALGHSAFTGMAIGALCGLTRPVGAAVVFAVVIALLFTLVRQKTYMASDTAISVFSSAAVALGIFLSTLGGQSFTKFNTLLIGDILSVAPAEIGLLALILLALVILWLTSYNQMMLSSVHQALADSRGIQGGLEELSLYRRHRRRGHHLHDLGGPAGHQRPAGPARRSGPEPGQKSAAVPPHLHPGRHRLRHRGPHGVVLLRHVHRRLHHVASGGVVLCHAAGAAGALMVAAGGGELDSWFRVVLFCLSTQRTACAT